MIFLETKNSSTWDPHNPAASARRRSRVKKPEKESQKKVKTVLQPRVLITFNHKKFFGWGIVQY